MSAQLAVIVTDATHVVHVGGEAERTVRVFDMPEGMAEYIEKVRDGSAYVSVSIAELTKEQP